GRPKWEALSGARKLLCIRNSSEACICPKSGNRPGRKWQNIACRGKSSQPVIRYAVHRWGKLLKDGARGDRARRPVHIFHARAKASRESRIGKSRAKHSNRPCAAWLHRAYPAEFVALFPR